MNTTQRTLLASVIACCMIAIIAAVSQTPAPAEDQSGYTLFGSTPRPIKHFNVTASASGDNTLIAAVEGKKLLVLALAIHSTAESTAAVNFYLHNDDNNLAGSATATIPIDKSGIDGYQGFVWANNQFGWVKTDTANEALSINLSAAQPVICVGAYVEL